MVEYWLEMARTSVQVEKSPRSDGTSPSVHQVHLLSHHGTLFDLGISKQVFRVTMGTETMALSR